MEYLNQSSSNISEISQRELVSNGVITVCFLLGVSTNIAVVVFLLRHLKKDNFTHQLMLNLAASDILRLFTLPLWMYNFNFAWKLGRASCKLLYLLFFISSYCSVLTVTVMSVQRYVAVLHRSQWAKLGSKGEKLLLLCLWTLALILSSPEAVKADLAEGQTKVCKRIHDEESPGILLCETLLGFVVPFSIMAMSYFCLHKKVKETPLFSNPRLGKLVIAILVTFFILWFPFHVMNLVKALGLALRSSSPIKSQRLMRVWESAGIPKSLTILNSCVNPLLYAWSFRRRSQKPRKGQLSCKTKMHSVLNSSRFM